MGKTKGKTVPVSLRALIQRINRKLAAEGECLKKARSAKAQQDLGDYYIIEISRNLVFGKDVDLEQLGRKIGALKSWEHVEE